MRKIHFFRPSTRAFFKEASQLKGFTLFDRLHGYIYGRWPYFYISVGTGQHRLARWIGPIGAWLITQLSRGSGHAQQSAQPGAVDPVAQHFAASYHGKVVPLEAARQLVSVREEINTTVPETVIPFKQARDIILHDPDHLVVLDCPCRAAREHPCLPLDVCLIVGEPFASFIVEHQPKRARRIGQAEALAILQAEDERGHVHHAFFKDAMLGRFYAICNCCTCCCGAMHAHRGGTPMLISSGYLAQVDPARCKGCARCAEVCPFGAVTITEGKLAQVDVEKCMGCGVCLQRCARKAITLQAAPEKGQPLILEDYLNGHAPINL